VDPHLPRLSRESVTTRYRSTVVIATSALASRSELGVGTSEDQQLRTSRRATHPGRVLWLPAALMLCLGLIGLDRHSVWRDEAASLVAARRSLPELWLMLRHLETVHAVYYTLLHGWLQLGTGEAWARMPSVLAMSAAAGLVGVLGARLVSVPVGLVAGLLFALNPSVSYYAQEARSTALVAATALLATWFLVRSVDRRATWWAGYATTCCVLVGLNLLALVVPLAHAVTLLCWRRRRRVLVSWAVATTPALVVCLVLAVAVRHQPYQLGWIPAPGIASVRDLTHLALGPNIPVALLIAALALVGILPGRAAAERRLAALALPMAALPAVVLLAASLVQPIFVARYVFPSVAAVALLAALGVVRLGRVLADRTRLAGRPALGLVAVVCVLVVGAGGLGTQRLDRTAESRTDDLGGAARIVAARARPGDAVLFLPSNRRLLSLAYPEAFQGVHDVGLDDEPAETGELSGRPLSLDRTVANLSTSPRVWAIGRPGLALLPSEQAASAELALLDREYTAVDRTGTHGVGITLYVKRPASS
jgi:mannosyltransferase